MTDLAKALLALVAAFVAGLVSLELASGDQGLAVATQGPWRTWPFAGARDGGLYARYHALRQGELPASRFLMARFVATADSDGRPLKAACRYRIEGPMPPARTWTLSLHPAEEEAQRQKGEVWPWLDAATALLDHEGRITVHISSHLQGGNWLRPPVREGAFVIVLHIYGMAPLMRERYWQQPLPDIRREDC